MSPSHSAISRSHLARLDDGFPGFISLDQLDRVVVEWCFAQRNSFRIDGLYPYLTPDVHLNFVAIDQLAHRSPAIYTTCILAWQDAYRGHIECSVGFSYISPLVSLVKACLLSGQPLSSSRSSSLVSTSSKSLSTTPKLSHYASLASVDLSTWAVSGINVSSFPALVNSPRLTIVEDSQACRCPRNHCLPTPSFYQSCPAVVRSLVFRS